MVNRIYVRLLCFCFSVSCLLFNTELFSSDDLGIPEDQLNVLKRSEFIVEIKPVYLTPNWDHIRPPFVKTFGQMLELQSEDKPFYSFAVNASKMSKEDLEVIKADLYGVYFYKESDRDVIKKLGILDDVQAIYLEDIPFTKELVQALKKFKNIKQFTFFCEVDNIDLLVDLIVCFSQLEALNLRGCHELSDKELKLISGMENISFLNFSGIDNISHEGINHLTKLKNLQRLNILHCDKISWKDVEFSKFKSLTEFIFSKKSLKDEHLSSMSQLPALETLHFSLCPDITDKGLRKLKRLITLKDLEIHLCRNIAFKDIDFSYMPLKRLDLWGCWGVTDESLKSINKIGTLKELDLGYIAHVTFEGADLSNLKRLEKIKFSYKKISDKSLKALGMLTGLKTLDLSHCKITDNGLKHLENLSELEELDLQSIHQVTFKKADPSKFKSLKKLTFFCNPVDDESLKKISKISSLRSIALGHCDITDEGIRSLAALKDLEELDLLALEHKITKESIDVISGMKNLKSLNLFGFSFISDKEIEKLGKLRKLESLDISQSRVTDKGLGSLGGLKNLRELNLYECEDITDRGIKNLEALEKLEILSLSDCNQLTDAVFDSLMKFKKLKRLYINKGFSNAKFESLQKTLPELDIRYHD